MRNDSLEVNKDITHFEGSPISNSSDPNSVNTIEDQIRTSTLREDRLLPTLQSTSRRTFQVFPILFHYKTEGLTLYAQSYTTNLDVVGRVLVLP